MAYIPQYRAVTSKKIKIMNAFSVLIIGSLLALLAGAYALFSEK